MIDVHSQVVGSPSLRPSHFEAIRIGREDAARFAEILRSGENVVFLGPRYVGKSYLAWEIGSRLRSDGEAHVLHVRLAERSGPDHSTLSPAMDFVASHLSQFGWRPPANPADLLASLRDFLERTPCHLFALVTGVDYLPDHQARQLLKAARILTSLPPSLPGRLTILLTGSVDLAPLVYGADSEFSCAHQYVVQGYDEETFSAYVDELTSAMGWSLADPADVHKTLFWQCGGQIYLLRLLTWSLLERRRCSGISPSAPLTTTELRERLAALATPFSSPLNGVMHAFRRLEQSIEALATLSRLFEHGEVAVSEAGQRRDLTADESYPTEIELCGVAVREGSKLRLACPLIESLARQYFSNWTLGDGFACNDRWNDAFACYRLAEAQGQRWACSASQRPRLRTALSTFQTALFREGARGVNWLQDFFVCGSRYLMGFDEISFWRYRGRWVQVSISEIGSESQVASEGESWREWAETVERGLDQHVLARCSSILPSVELLREGNNPLERDAEPYAVLVGLPRRDPTDAIAAVFSNFAKQAPLTREHRSLCDGVLDTYCRAYKQAVAIARQAREARVQRHLLESIPAILEAVTGGPVTTRLALEAAATRLRQIGYRRVMFSLVDRQRRRIVGVLDSREPGEPDLAAMTDWPLDIGAEGMTDVQPWCVLRGETLVIDEASSHPQANPGVVRDAGIKAMALLPIRFHEDVLGTVLVERRDRRLPPRDEIEALEYFANQLGTVLGLMARLDLLEGALNVQQDALVLVDEQQRVRYINHLPTGTPKIDPAWQDDGALVDATTLLPQNALMVLSEAWRVDHKLSRYLNLGKEPDAWHVLRAAPIRDWRDVLVGGLIQVQDITVFKRMFESHKKMASCCDQDELMDAILEATRSLGHTAGRIYVLDEDSGRLVGRKQFGFPEGSWEASQFAAGEVVLPARDNPGSYSWLCYEKGHPVVFAYNNELPDGREYTNTAGLQVINVYERDCPIGLRKRAGELWIDVPLFSREHNREIGKLTVDCPADYGPGQFEQLRTLAEVCSAHLVAMSYRESEQARRIASERMAMEKAVGATAHRLLAKLASLGTMTHLYELAGDDQAAIQELNKEFERRLGALQDVLTHVRDRLRPVEPKLQPTDVVALTKKVLAEQLPKAQWSFESNQSAMYAQVDAKLLQETLEELLMNSKKAVPETGVLKVAVNIETRDAGTVSITVRDNGPGIPAELCERVFEDLFSQWPGKERGTGIGLGFVRRILESHRGTVLATPSASGACFLLTLPSDAGMGRSR